MGAVFVVDQGVNDAIQFADFGSGFPSSGVTVREMSTVGWLGFGLAGRCNEGSWLGVSLLKPWVRVVDICDLRDLGDKGGLKTEVLRVRLGLGIEELGCESDSELLFVEVSGA
jgi:hypothetical protein